MIYDTFPHFPEGNLEEVWSWKTDILRSYNGHEQRISLRDNPRVRTSATFLIDDVEARKVLNRNIKEQITGVIQLPLWQYARQVTAPSAAATSRIYFDLSGTTIAAGDAIALCDLDSHSVVIRTVDTLEADGVTLTVALSSALTTRNLVCPVQLATLSANSYTWDRVTGEFAVQFNSFLDKSILPEDPNVTLTYFNGLPVLEKEFLAGSREGFAYKYELLDNDVGAQQYVSRETLVMTLGTKNFSASRVLDPEDFEYWRVFFDTIKGAWKPFYLSTQLPDFTVYPLVQAADYILIQELEFEPTEAYGAIEILYGDGSKSWHWIDTGTPDPIPVTVGAPFQDTYDSVLPQNLPGVTTLAIDSGRVTATYEVRIDWFYPEPTGANHDNFHALDMDFFDAEGGIVTNNSFPSFDDTAGGAVSDVLDPNTREIRVRSRNQSVYGWVPPEGADGLAANGLARKLVSELRLTLGSDLYEYDGVTYKALAITPSLPDSAKVGSVQRVSFLLKVRAYDEVKLSHESFDTRITMRVASTNEG